MNIIIATSRGKAVQPLFLDQAYRNNIPTKFYSFPGATFSTLTSHTLDILKYEQTANSNTHIYILGGLPDVTIVLKNKPHEKLYQEVIMQGNTQQNINRISGRLSNMTKTIRATGATLTICTIVPSSISAWNYKRLTQRRTLSLKHFGKYPDMQNTQQEVIIHINQEITSINSRNNLPTPFLHRTIAMSLKTNNAPRYKFTFDHFVDGVHPTDELASLWADKLFTIVKHNTKTAQPSLASASLPSPMHTHQLTYYNTSDSDSEEGAHSRIWRPS